MANYIVVYDNPYGGDYHHKFAANSFTELYVQIHQYFSPYSNPKCYKAIYTEIDMVEFGKLGKVFKLKEWLNDHGYHQTNLADDILKVLDL